MGKYIIRLERGETAYKTVNSNGKPMIQLLAPIPYTEPDLEQVKKEAYEKGWKEAEDHYEKGYNDGYDTGLEDAWKVADKIFDMPCLRREQIFSKCDSVGVWDILRKYSASEAIEKIRQYEQKQEMDGLRQNIQTIVDQCGYTLDEIAAVLEKMREGE